MPESTHSTPILVPPATATPTLPATFTPLPVVDVTESPERIFQPVTMSGPDEQEYNLALADIERYRKGGLTLHLQTLDGNPLSGYQLEYEQVSHDFWFGTGGDVYTLDLGTNAGINSWTVLPGWWLVQPSDGKYELTFTNFWTGIDEIASLGLAVKTNDVFAPGGEGQYMRNLPFDSYLARLAEHIATLVKRFASSVDQWEAILEPNFGNHNPYAWTHDQYLDAIATSIRAIRDSDPSARIEVNLSYPCGGIDWLDNFAIVDEMLQHNIDFDVLGLQLYYNSYILNPSPYPFARMSLSEMSACVDRYQEMLAPHNKAIAGSEFGVPSSAPPGIKGYWGHPWSEDLQAQYLTTAYTIFFAKPLNHSITWWDFQSSLGSFVYQGGLIQSDGVPTKGYWALKHLIRSWTSSGTGSTDQNGEFVLRGFAGQYNLTITEPASGSQMLTKVQVAEQDSNTLTLVFEPDNEITARRAELEALVQFAIASGKPTRARQGQDMLALSDHYSSLSDPDSALRAIRAGIIACRAPISLNLMAARDFHLTGFAPGSFESKEGYAEVPSGTTLYYEYDFPPGHTSVKVEALGTAGDQGYPRMVIGIGGHYSQPVVVDHAGNYLFESDLTGSEGVLTIRFLYEDDQTLGDRVLYVGTVAVEVYSDFPPE